MRTRRPRFPRILLAVMLLLAMTATAFAASPIEEPESKYIECPDCGTLGVVLSDEGVAVPCGTCADSEYVGYIQSPSSFYNTAFAQCDHVNHVSTQLLYTVSVAAISFVCYAAAGLLASAGLPGLIMLPFGILITIGFLVVIKKLTTKGTA